MQQQAWLRQQRSLASQRQKGLPQNVNYRYRLLLPVVLHLLSLAARLEKAIGTDHTTNTRSPVVKEKDQTARAAGAVTAIESIGSTGGVAAMTWTAAGRRMQEAPTAPAEPRSGGSGAVRRNRRQSQVLRSATVTTPRHLTETAIGTRIAVETAATGSGAIVAGTAPRKTAGRGTRRSRKAAAQKGSAAGGKQTLWMAAHGAARSLVPVAATKTGAPRPDSLNISTAPRVRYLTPYTSTPPFGREQHGSHGRTLVWDMGEYRRQCLPCSETHPAGHVCRGSAFAFCLGRRQRTVLSGVSLCAASRRCLDLAVLAAQ